MPKKVEELELFAWVGEDELGSGEIGIKQGLCPAGLVPLVSVDKEKLVKFASGLQQQVNNYGKPIRLCKFVFSETSIVINPE